MRIRGTALVARDGHFLLVRDRGAPSFSLPGGGQNPGEPALATAARELYEELGMSAARATRLFAGDYAGRVNFHKVTLIETDDPPKLCSRELEAFIWWNGKDDVPRYPHVDEILRRCGLLA
ncbi:MAG: NUDIX domain-containing protein [Cyanobacteria bacterium RI_101]|nr:NUDIX domain-containing protein [Cyanobacteria bacterium RI_101]